MCAMLLYQNRTEVNLPELHDFLRCHLLEDIMTFWERHGFSPDRPGLDVCLADDGSLLSDDRYMRSQLRAIWTFSALYNRIEKRELWLQHAMDLYEFSVKYGRDDNGDWCFRVSPDGRILDGPLSIFTPGFAIYGMTELYRATGDRRVLETIMQSVDRVLPKIEQWDRIRIWPQALPPGMKAHAVAMIFSSAFDALSEVVHDPAIDEAARFQCLEVMDRYIRPERGGFMYEYLNLDNTVSDTPAGRTVNPGHALESMWFQIHQLRKCNDTTRLACAVATIRRHIEAGWDPQYGGLLHGIDAEGRQPVFFKHADVKLWWPATEALYALLLAHALCGESWCLEWYRRVHDYSFTHFPVPQYGEWTQRLDRRGSPVETVIALPVKDPFHLPRALIMAVTLLEKVDVSI